MVRASAVAVDIVRGVQGDDLGSPTPCAELNVRALVNHLAYWTGVRGHVAGLKQSPHGDRVVDGFDFTGVVGWADEYASRSAATALVWSEPEAWEGETALTGAGVSPMPARFVGGVVLGEWLVHGWDLAVATGQKVDVDDELAAVLYEDIVGKAEMARRYGVYGPEVAVPADAPLFERALGLAGRDPSWRRQGQEQRG
nr:TIGR03086 family metal-binding protein [Streptomyces sp. SID12488]